MSIIKTIKTIKKADFAGISLRNTSKHTSLAPELLTQKTAYSQLKYLAKPLSIPYKSSIYQNRYPHIFVFHVKHCELCTFKIYKQAHYATV